MRIHTGKSRKRSTEFIRANTKKCEACWLCIEKCKYDVLGRVDIWFHRHVVIRNAGNCRGCKCCVAVCPNGVFEPIVKVADAAM